MERRAFMAVLTGSFLAAPFATAAQKSEKIPLVGILGIGSAPTSQELARSIATNPFWLSMRQLGWVDGQNMVVERRFGETTDQLRRGAAELVRLKVDVLFVSSAGLAKLNVDAEIPSGERDVFVGPSVYPGEHRGRHILSRWKKDS